MAMNILKEETLSCCYGIGQVKPWDKKLQLLVCFGIDLVVKLDMLPNFLLFSFSVSVMIEDTKLTFKSSLNAAALRKRL